MRRYLGIMITIVIVLAVLAALSAVQYTKLDREEESELTPNRSTYNTGPTGTRAFYELLTRTGYRVSRWNREYRYLGETSNATLVMIGPSRNLFLVGDRKTGMLMDWVAGGGRLLLISRDPDMEIRWVDAVSVHQGMSDPDIWTMDADKLVDGKSDQLLTQPTMITRGLKGLALSRLAGHLTFRKLPPPLSADPATPENSDKKSSEETEKTPELSDADDQAEDADEPSGQLQTKEIEGETPAGKLNRGLEKFSAPVVHLGDEQGAVLADFDYGRGRIVFLADPFVVANNGIGRGANLKLALNLVNSLGGRDHPVFFDEFLHGYRQAETTILGYFRGTSFVWVLAQGLLIAVLIAWSAGRRFARPLPLPKEDRNSPLEFVSSMARLQQTAKARDLALENIYPRFRARLTRSLGLPVRTSTEEIIDTINRRRLKISPAEVRWALRESEQALASGKLDDQHLMQLVTAMRRILSPLR
jgi:hypothetical protein